MAKSTITTDGRSPWHARLRSTGSPFCFGCDLTTADNPHKTELSRWFNALCRTLVLAILIVGISREMIGQAHAQPKRTLAIIVASEESPYFKQLVESARAQCAKLRYELIVLADDFQVPQQTKLFEDAMNKKCAAIICTSAYSKALVSQVKIAQAAGIVCVFVGEGIDTSDAPVVHIMANDYQGASIGAQYFVDLMGKSGKYVELNGYPSSVTARMRSEGYNNIISRYSDLKKVDAPIGDGERKRAVEQITDTMQRNPDLKGIISTNDEMALGAEEALRAMGLERRCVVVGFNGSANAIQSILDRGIQATVQLPLREMAGLAVREADILINSADKVENGEEWAVDCRLIDYKEAKRLADGKSEANEPAPTITRRVPDSPWPTPNIFGSLQASATELMDSPLREKSGATEELQVIQDSGNYLQGLIKEQKMEPSPEFLYCLTIDAWQLANTAMTVAVAALGPGMAGLDKVAADVKQITGSVRSKAEHAQKHPGDPFAKVAVTVTTKDSNNSVVSRLQVHYCLVGLMPYADKHKTFNNFSSPTTQGIEPGNYEIWASNGAKEGSYKYTSDVGGGGESERCIDVEAP